MEKRENLKTNGAAVHSRMQLKQRESDFIVFIIAALCAPAESNPTAPTCITLNPKVRFIPPYCAQRLGGDWSSNTPLPDFRFLQVSTN